MSASFDEEGKLPVAHLLLPAKDEADNLPPLLARAKKARFQAVVLDDGSADKTAEVAQEMGAVVLKHEKNEGLAQTLRDLLDWALTLSDEEVVVFMDADGTMDPMDALPGVEALKRGEGDVALFSRYLVSSWWRHLPPKRIIFSLGAKTLLNLAGVRASDPTSGFRAYRVGFLRKYKSLYPNWFEASGFEGATEMLWRAMRMGGRTVEFPALIRYDLKRGASKMRLWRTVVAYLRLFFKAVWGRV